MESRAKALGHPIHQMLIPFPFGLIDYLAIPQGTRAKSVGLLHGVGNVFVLILFAVSLWMRYSSPAAAFTREPTTVAVVIALAAFALAGATAWLGGELVERTIKGFKRTGAPLRLSQMPAAQIGIRRSSYCRVLRRD